MKKLDNPLDILFHYWHFKSFRGEQQHIITSILQKKDTLAIMPTSGGKSICFQIPALMNKGVCIVISPLIALMKDQVIGLRKRGIEAIAINSEMNYAQTKTAFYNALKGQYQLIYLSPEKIAGFQIREMIGKLNVNLIAVDEAHCVSQWGHDFRPQYLKISSLRELLPSTPILALTASATSEVQKDILLRLGMKHAAVFHQEFTRKNLSFSVFRERNKKNKLLHILQKVPGSCIVYCNSRKRTEEISAFLEENHISATSYHAGLSQEERTKKQKYWTSGQVRIMVATSAFGMGIDKKDVRSVIHYELPLCIEDYYQQAGRAGRDGKTAFAVLLYSLQEILDMENLPSRRFPSLPEIRRTYQHLSDYFQLPVGAGEGQSFPYDETSFCEKFSLDKYQVKAIMRLLEEESFIQIRNGRFQPSRIEILQSRDSLKQFAADQRQFIPILETLLRGYPHILTESVEISEKKIANQLAMAYQTVYDQLKILHKIGLIRYEQGKSVDFIQFLTARAQADYLNINLENYHIKKDRFIYRLQKMKEYVFIPEDTCRSTFICNYFGETTASNCGICDHCLKQKKKRG